MFVKIIQQWYPEPMLGTIAQYAAHSCRLNPKVQSALLVDAKVEMDVTAFNSF